MSAHAQPEPSAWLGVAVEKSDPVLAYQLDRADTGVVARRVCPDSPADKAGVKERDLILSFNDIPVIKPAELTRMVRACAPGQKVKLGVLRKSKLLSLETTLGECEDEEIVWDNGEEPQGLSLIFHLDSEGNPIPMVEKRSPDALAELCARMAELVDENDTEIQAALNLIRSRVDEVRGASASQAQSEE